MQHKRHRQGFTLIELLIVLLVLGFIMAVVIASVSKSKEKGSDLEVRKTLTNIQVKLSADEVAAGTTDFQKAYLNAGGASELATLAAKLGVPPENYLPVITSDAYAIAFPLKRGGYYCVDYKQAKEITGKLSATGTPSCDNIEAGTGDTGGTGGSGTNNPPVANAGSDQSITLPTSSTTLSGSGTDTDGAIVAYAWSKVSGPAGATITSPSTASTNITGLTAGSYVFKLAVTDNGGAIGEDTVVVTVSNQVAGGTPYNGPHTIPGTIQAEDFDQGGEGIAYHDSDPNNATGVYRPSEGVDLETSVDAGGGYDVGWVTTGEWTNYTANVTATGTYTVSVRVAAPNSQAMQLKVDGTTITSITIPSTGGWQNWTTVTVPNISLTAGTHIIQTLAPSGGYNFNYMTFSTAAANQAPTANAGADQTITLPTSSVTLSGSGTDPDGSIASYAWTKVSGGTAMISSPSAASTNVTGLAAGTYTFQLTVTDNKGATGTDTVMVTVNAQAAQCYNCPHNIPGTIQAEDFDNGGQNVSYYDTSTGNTGGKYRTTDVDIETTSDTTGAYDVGWTADGEWLKYTVTVASTGNYTMLLRGASASGGGYIRMKMDGQFLTAVVLPNTGGWQTWQDASVNGIPLTAGTHTMEIDMVIASGGGMNLNYFTFTSEGVVSGPNPAARTLALHGTLRAANGADMYFYDSLPRGYYDSATKTYPLMVFLHGAGEAPPAAPTSLLTGAGVVNQINNGAQLEYTINGKTETFVVLAPQSDWWWNVNNIDKIIEYAKFNYRIDTTRIYLTGLSAGSGGGAKYFAYSPTYGDAFPRKIAAVALFDGMTGSLPTTETSKDNATTVPLNYCYASSTSLPLWFFESSQHYPAWMESLIAAVNACTPAPNLKVSKNTDADSYWKGYVTDHTYYNPNVYEWLLQQHR